MTGRTAWAWLLEMGGALAQVVRTEAEEPRTVDPDDGAERRGASRFTLLIRAAKLVSPDHEALCVVRDASQSGAKVRLYHAIGSIDGLVLELANGERFPVEPVWETDGYAGLRFLEEVELSRLVETERGQFPSRRLRLNTDIPVRLAWAGLESGATIENISQQGAGLLCDEHLAIDQLLRIELAGQPPLYAKVRWRRKPHYGVIFEQTLSFDELARLTAG